MWVSELELVWGMESVSVALIVPRGHQNSLLMCPHQSDLYLHNHVFSMTSLFIGDHLGPLSSA